MRPTAQQWISALMVVFVGAIVYDRLRSNLVHWLASADNISFSKSTYKVKPIPDVGFEILRAALGRILGHAKEISLKSGDLFGHA